jgi:hypothetical protein
MYINDWDRDKEGNTALDNLYYDAEEKLNNIVIE